MTDRVELRALTSVRGIAAWAVVLYHVRLSMTFLPQRAVDMLAKGYLAVDFFFLLSGFVIWMTWSRRLADDGWRAVPRFLQRRIARIWPLHVVVLAGAVALALLLAATGRHDPREFPFGELPLHLLLVQNWGITPALTWNDPAWSISCELGAYLAFPFLIAAIDWRRMPGWAVAGAIATLCVALHGIFRVAGAPTLGTDITRLGLTRCLIEFAIGTAVAALWLRWKSTPAPAAIAAATLGAILLTATAGGLLPETLGTAPAFAALLLALALTANRPGNPLDARPLHYLGEISYATYLSHFLLWFVCKLLLVDDPHRISPVIIALYLLLVLMGSVALYHLVERPAQRAINRLTLPRPARLARQGRSTFL